MQTTSKRVQKPMLSETGERVLARYEQQLRFEEDLAHATIRNYLSDLRHYFNAGQSILVANGNPKKINNVTDLCGKTVGVQDGTIELDTLNAENQAACKANHIKLTVLGAQTDVINLLVTGRVDATFQDSPVTDYNLYLNPGHFEVAGSIINAAPEGISIRKGDTSMFNAIKQAFNAVKSNGTYDRLFTKWQLNPTQKVT